MGCIPLHRGLPRYARNDRVVQRLQSDKYVRNDRENKFSKRINEFAMTAYSNVSLRGTK